MTALRRPSPPNLALRFHLWRTAGCSVRAASALAFAECDTTSDVRAKGKAFFRSLPNCGQQTLGEIEDLIGGWPEDRSSSPQTAIAAALRLSIADREEAMDAAADAVAALYRSGFVIISKEGSCQ